MELINYNNKNKNVILGKDLAWIVGTEKDNNENVVVLPFIYNKEGTKIKVLTDNKIYVLSDVESGLCRDILCNAYNLDYIEYSYYYVEDWKYKINQFLYVKPEDKISQKKLDKIVDALKIKFTKKIKLKKIEEEKKNFEESYKNF